MGVFTDDYLGTRILKGAPTETRNSCREKTSAACCQHLPGVAETLRCSEGFV